MSRIRHRFRSAITGRWVSRIWAKLHPSTTVSERYDTAPLPPVKD